MFKTPANKHIKQGTQKARAGPQRKRGAPYMNCPNGHFRDFHSF